MTIAAADHGGRLSALEDELENFRSMMEYVHSIPAEVSFRNIDAYGETFPLNGVLGGDHIIFVDFERRYNLGARIDAALADGNVALARKLAENRDRLGVLLADSCGHEMTDSLLSAMLHQAFLTGVLYELDMHGEVTSKLFDTLNTRFHRSSSVTKYLTMVYGEISEDGTFRFISAGHPRPLVFSAEFDRFVEIDSRRMQTFLPVGMFPSEGDIDVSTTDAALPATKRYTVNEVNLMGVGDILLLFSDGVADHERDTERFALRRFEETVRRSKHLTPQQIVYEVRRDMEHFAPATDDVSLVVIKRTR